MWDNIVKQFSGFQTAVITGVDAAGYPASARCKPLLEAATQTIRVALPLDAMIEPGPAGMLCHKHDQFLWRQESFIVRGVLARDEQGWVFRPKQLIPGIHPSPISLMRFLATSRRKAKQYLAARRLPRPNIPWDAINAVKAQAKQWR
jgi:hypothetical protein